MKSNPNIVRGSRLSLSSSRQVKLRVSTANPHHIEHASSLPPHLHRLNSIPDIYQRLASSFPDNIAIEDPHNPVTSKSGPEVTSLALWHQIESASNGFRSLGLLPGEKVALFAESSRRWLVADQAIMLAGGVDCVRGSSAPPDELAFILKQSESIGLVVQDIECLKKLTSFVTEESRIRFIILLWTKEGEWGEAVEILAGGHSRGVSILTFSDLLSRSQDPTPPLDPPISRQSLATLVFTSGTSGKPKAVALTHGNLLYQVENLDHFLPVKPGQTSLSLLPPWHIYERATSYYITSRGAKLVYSNVKKFAADLQRVKPDFLVCVPLVLESLYSKIMMKIKASSLLRRAVVLGLISASISHVRAMRVVNGLSLAQVSRPNEKKIGFFSRLLSIIQTWIIAIFTAPLIALARKIVFSKMREAIGVTGHIVCGGGGLAPHLDDFFEALGLPVLNGYGLTETSPVLSCRRSVLNIRGTIGLPTPQTEIKIVDLETHEEVEDGKQGLIIVRGPGVFQCYDSDADATAHAFLFSGWFDTGDLGWKVGSEWRSMKGSLVISGRAKDTIVLSNGKNIEPEVIEASVSNSPLIKSAIVVGQDKRELGALIIPEPDVLEGWLREGKLEAATGREEIRSLLLKEVQEMNRTRSDFKPHEQVIHVVVVLDGRGLSMEEGTLTRTMKLKRAEAKRYFNSELQELLGALR